MSKGEMVEHNKTRLMQRNFFWFVFVVVLSRIKF